MRDRYWHNMAARIQRAFRNYLRYKEECARRIQKFWKNNKEGIDYAKIRDYGHQVLAGRKERRRFSLISYRRFMGDYLDVKGRSPLGEELQAACDIAGWHHIVLACFNAPLNLEQNLWNSVAESNSLFRNLAVRASPVLDLWWWYA